MAGTHEVSAEKYAVLQSFVFFRKSLRNLKVLIPGILSINHPLQWSLINMK
jgi:hypothetical protein